MSGHNQVDLSDDMIDREFAALMAGADVSVDDLKGPAEEGELIEGESEGQQQAAGGMQALSPEDEYAAKLEAAAFMIKGLLKKGSEWVAKVELDDSEHEKCARAIAAAVCKYYHGDIFMLIAQYKELFIAAGALIMWSRVMITAVKLKNESEDKRERESEASEEIEGAVNGVPA